MTATPVFLPGESMDRGVRLATGICGVVRSQRLDSAVAACAPLARNIIIKMSKVKERILKSAKRKTKKQRVNYKREYP